MLTPKPRGELSAEIFGRLTADAELGGVDIARCESPDDAHIALWAMYELHYRGFEDVDPAREWDPELLRVRRALEEVFEAELESRFTPPAVVGDPVDALWEVIEGNHGPSVARFIRRRADRAQVLEIMRHRSVYHLKESDPVAWVVPRLGHGPQAALMELQFDEYGGGDPNRLHAHLFSEALEDVGLSPDYGAYVDEVPVEILQMNNAMSLFGLHRRLRGAALGHLAAFEATSSIPSRRVAQGLGRLGFGERAAAYYEEHVEADAVHEQLATRTICGALMAEEPELIPSVLFGAFTCLDLEDRYARRVLEEWTDSA
jgi:hypothetical protein